MLSTACGASRISFCWIIVDCTPCRCLTMCLLSVVVDGGRYLLMSLYSIPGNDLNWRLAIPHRNAAFVGEHTIWWWYFSKSTMLVVGMSFSTNSVVITDCVAAIVHSW